MNLICPIFYKDLDSAMEEILLLNRAECDMVEIRLDRNLAYCVCDIENLVSLCKKKCILTIRTSQEGGHANLSDIEYEERINDLFDITNALIDVELMRLKKFKENKFLKHQNHIILSYHNFTETPENLSLIWQEMDAYHPYIEKIACMPNNNEDILRLLLSCFDHKTNAFKCAISMSEKGMISRIIGELFESEYTFCTISTISAPGQLPLEKMVQYLNILE